MFLGLIVGTLLGSLAGFYGGLTDSIIMRGVDIFYSIRNIMTAVVIVSLLGTSTVNLMIALAFFLRKQLCAIVRAAVMTIRDQEYVESSYAMGLPTWKIILKHILPNCLSPIIVQITLQIGTTIISASLSELPWNRRSGSGPEWGALLSAGRSHIRDASYMCIIPGFAIMLTVLALNLLGDGLRDALDPEDEEIGEVRPMAEDLVLKIKDLVVHYETEDADVHAVNGIDIEIRKKHTLGLVGETGAGKTTTAMSILNLVPNSPGVIKSGEIYLEGEDVLQMSAEKLEHMRGNDVAMIFQDPMTALNPVMTVGDQIAESIELHQNLNKKDAL